MHQWADARDGTRMVEYRRDGYLISTDREQLDLEFVHGFLCNSAYWAQGRSLATVRRSIEGSLCFGIYKGAQQVGFARVVTDRATFAWLCDLFVAEGHRGQGLGKWLVACIVAHPDLQNLRIFLLATRDAHELYRRYGGFEALPAPDRLMARRRV
jgi:GNAT superfamily N-acetyltransferase